ncbi:MarR family winged helix-turn-helix transcriptional regulator [Agromyces atrinae]|uniref:MarR family transcriptional regulator n=1 Tax=Agromyces atrinae TaxID=592376 RepID=A0A4Q2M9Z8_9MICO|nr:MarR family transcriptional regulator [Agromyces atrinae]NYD67560.1 DNA-binding MarR family transcriptional regulator [Agromyces atrinae]RXZ88227.1 MarR family transcriptional regulator [Agromyces atrinae]
MLPDVDLDTPALKPCAAIDDPFSSDLTWLVHRVERSLTGEFDAACRAVGLKDMRDTLVLAVAGDGVARTQIEIAQTLGLDKTTLGAIIDRLEERSFLVRVVDPSNKRVRRPRTTDAGYEILDRALAARDEAVNQSLQGFTTDDIASLRTLLWRVATRSAEG